MKICVLTTTRAEYGLLSRLIKKMKDSPLFDVRVAVSGTHLLASYGETFREIENDGIVPDAKIPIFCDERAEETASDVMSAALRGFSEYFNSRRPDMLLVLGDRFETLAVCLAAFNARIPIAHVHGGEVTYGALDDAYRHCITKLSYLHFTATEEYRNRVIQLGEDPERVFNVGAPGVENALFEQLLDREGFYKSVGLNAERPFAVVTFHPATNDDGDGLKQCNELLAALDAFNGYDFIITKANADAGGMIINDALEAYAEKRDNVFLIKSLGMKRYLSALKYASAVIGNSSSGIIEAPSFDVPTVNIGTRQEGRAQASSVINCEAEKDSIVKAIEKALYLKISGKTANTVNPYGDGKTTDKIIEIISSFADKKIDLKKAFYDIKTGDR